MRIRKNIKNLSDAQLNRYFNAVKQLNSGPKPTKWNAFAKMHVDFYPQVHMKPLFLVWHRYFLYFIEKELQKIDPSVTIPYWDWTAEASNPNADPIYSDKYFGRVNGNSGCVDSGPFRDFTAYYWHDGSGSTHCLRRKKVFDEEVTDDRKMDTLYLNDTPINRFAGNIEGVPHGRIHNGIGGEFSGHASPEDPLFYSHHAFIDKLWFDWQMRHPEQMDQYHVNRRNPVAPWGFPILQAIDTSDRMCYAYKEEHFPWTPTTTMSRSMMVPEFTVEPYTVTKNVTTVEQLLEHDLNFVTKNNELTDLETNSKIDINNPPVKILDVEFLLKMKFNYTNVRQNELRELEADQFLNAVNAPAPTVK
ncbi:Di-copper centre-containing protein [Neoconidiobolus thromboides FSU 785]|nr:Di-copper centre-containing protein [Neoconidiobolus thromboides FSU 785]